MQKAQHLEEGYIKVYSDNKSFIGMINRDLEIANNHIQDGLLA